MKSYVLKTEQAIPITLDMAWDFFSSPLNLARITPPDMGFVVTSDYAAETKIYPGMIITYKIAPLLGITMNWMTEITHVADKQYFTDEQRFGPFKFWHHQHHFRAIEGGVEMTDILTYGLPFGIIGRMAHGILVKNKVKEIFAFREKKVIELFGEYPTRLPLP